MDVEVIVPDTYMGDIAGGLASKRARINGTDSAAGGTVVISAQAPLSELADFQTELKSMTGGQGRYTLQLSHYDPVPADIQRKLISEFKPREIE